MDQVVAAGELLVRAGRLALRLFTRSRLGPTDAWAAVRTARFMAAHELIERADRQVMADPDPDVDLIQIQQPRWFGGLPIYKED